ncbi:transposase [Haloferula chungangensis]|uniref:Transposase n=1 Tax=Haloferula chungangensis TaxID=1048331 RepID=A0ABW2LB54_9BACT
MASTSETTATSTIIKSDRIGRTRYSDSYKAEVVAAYERSGMSGQAFAEQCGIKYPTFAAWVAKSRKPGHEVPSRKPEQHFLLAELSGSSSDTPLRVELPGGAIAHVSSASQAGLLAALLKTLA